MTASRPIPDVEKLVVAALLEDPDLASVVGTKVSTELPEAFPDGQRVRLWRVGGTPADASPEWIDRPLLQVEGYGATKEEAFETISEAIEALHRLAGAALPGAVVTRVQRVTGPAWSNDPTTDTPRYLLGVVLYLHPAAL